MGQNKLKKKTQEKALEIDVDRDPLMPILKNPLKAPNWKSKSVRKGPVE